MRGWTPLLAASRYGYINIVKLLLSKGANVCDKSNADAVASELAENSKVKSLLRKWPLSMAVIAFQELGIFNQLDASSIVDLRLFLSGKDDE